MELHLPSTHQEVQRLEAELAVARETIARQAQELMEARSELEQMPAPKGVRLNSELRVVSPQPELIDIRVQQPFSGSRVFALGAGGVLVPIVWGKNEGGFFGAWMAYPNIPESVKEWLGTAWKR